MPAPYRCARAIRTGYYGEFLAPDPRSARDAHIFQLFAAASARRAPRRCCYAPLPFYVLQNRWYFWESDRCYSAGAARARRCWFFARVFHTPFTPQYLTVHSDMVDIFVFPFSFHYASVVLPLLLFVYTNPAGEFCERDDEIIVFIFRLLYICLSEQMSDRYFLFATSFFWTALVFVRGAAMLVDGAKSADERIYITSMPDFSL